MERRIASSTLKWTPFAWVRALAAGEVHRRSLYLGRDYRWATRQARIGEFESAWSQRTRQARADYRATLAAEVAANDNAEAEVLAQLEAA